TVDTELIVDEGETQAKSGLEPDLEEDDSEDDPMLETPATEGQSSEDEILLRDMLSESRQQKKMKRQAKPARKARKSKSPRGTTIPSRTILVLSSRA
ncbi:hypothetical protein Dimus_013549, partial [Dionaea muscipula]